MKALRPITVLAALLGLFTSACDRNPQGLASGRGSDLVVQQGLPTLQRTLVGRIAFHSFRDGDGDIYVMNADGSQVTNVTNSSDQEFDPVWSPDGKRIVFGRCEGSCPSFLSEVWVINADGTGLKQLTHGGGFPGAWSPDGKRIAFVANRVGDDVSLEEVFTMNVDGSGVTQVTSNHFRDFPTAFSPNGKQILFQSDRDGKREGSRATSS